MTNTDTATAYLLASSGTGREHVVTEATGVALCGSDQALPMAWASPVGIVPAALELADAGNRGHQACARCVKAASKVAWA